MRWVETASSGGYSMDRATIRQKKTGGRYVSQIEIAEKIDI